jgi:Tfp pilus assembly protein PilN
VRSCLTCGASLEGRKATAKFCSDLHRAQYKRGKRPPEPAELAGVTVIHGEPVDDPADDAAVLPSLEDVALLLAATMAAARATTPTAVAGLSREYRATLAEIEARKPTAKDGIDEIAERRARRGSA